MHVCGAGAVEDGGNGQKRAFWGTEGTSCEGGAGAVKEDGGASRQRRVNLTRVQLPLVDGCPGVPSNLISHYITHW